jgi:hypothetical protein
MEPLARIDLLDLEDTTLAPTHSVDGVYAEPAIRNRARHTRNDLGTAFA